MILLGLLSLVAATPEIKFPFNNQLPPVARYGEAYTYTLNPDTFSSSETITLSCPDLPSWLSFDASSSTFSGTAPSEKQGDQYLNFTILAADSYGTIVSDCTLALIDSAAPDTTSPLVSVLREAGPTADPDSVVLTPGESFELEFPENYFSSDGRPVIGHYSVTDQHAPLPIWLHFDGSSRKFWGTAPTVNSDIAQAEKFPIVYIESTVSGFTTASSLFNLLVGAHSFATNLSVVALNVTKGEEITYQVPFNDITLNNKSITAANVSSVGVTSLPSWLQYNDANYSVSGLAEDTGSFLIPFTVTDLYNDTVQFSVNMTVQEMDNSTVFKSSVLGPVNVTEGTFFSWSLKDSLVSDNVQISISSNADWISYQSGNYSIQGDVPKSFNGTTVELSANKINNRKRDTGTTATLTLLGVSPTSSIATSSTASSTHVSSSTSSTSTAKPTGTSAAATATDSAANSSSKHHSKKLALALGLAIPLGIIALLSLLFLIFFCRRRRQNRRNAYGSPQSTYNEKVSKPILIKSDDSPAFMAQPQPSPRTDNTMIETPPLDHEDTKDWTTPQRVSAYNFMQMDGNSKENLVNGNSAASAVAGDSSKAAAISGPVAVGAMRGATANEGSAAAAAEDQAKYSNVPRASWRHTNITERRWQDNRLSYNSLADVNDQNGQMYPAGHTYLPRDESSGIVHTMGGSDLSSPEHSMYFNQKQRTATVPEAEEDNASSEYHTASSGDEAEEPFNGDSSPDIKPYKTATGQFEFRPNERAETQAQVRNSQSVTRQTNGHKTQNSQSGELAFI